MVAGGTERVYFLYRMQFDESGSLPDTKREVRLLLLLLLSHVRLFFSIS